jgi:hypothetical protein
MAQAARAAAWTGWSTHFRRTTRLDPGGRQLELKALLGIRQRLLTPGDLPLKFQDQDLAEAHPVGQAIALRITRTTCLTPRSQPA